MTESTKYGLYEPDYEHDSCGIGFVAHIKGEASHRIVEDANTVLCSMDHRGARGAEVNSGDGAGILTTMPHAFMRAVAKEAFGTALPPDGEYGVGNIFLPHDENLRALCKKEFNDAIAARGQRLIGWRELPLDPDAADLGPTALNSMPYMEQLFVAMAPGLTSDVFERELYLLRKLAINAIRVKYPFDDPSQAYPCSLSSRTIVYKGMLVCDQLRPLYPDLQDERYEVHLAMVHSRFSTNTQPSWSRAQPMRCVSHNGEINTVRGNRNQLGSRQGVARSELFGDDLRKLYPIIDPTSSDTGSLDNALEFLSQGGRTMPEAIVMMIPEAWQNDPAMPQAKRDFYEFHSCLMEPWDGPASIVFTDGRYVGAVLDRNGLRPSRYYLTEDDRVIMASEVGVLPVPPESVKFKGRLEPGKIFLIDFEEGRMIPDEELKQRFATREPYGKWLAENRVRLSDLPAPDNSHGYEPKSLLQRMRAFGFTEETLQFMLRPMVDEKRDPVGSMGNDAALAVLSDKPRLIYDYFKQLFAQVTNPPIDSIREEIVMTLDCYIGPEDNILDAKAEDARRLLLEHPILTNEHIAAIKQINKHHWKTKTLDITWDRSEGAAGLKSTLLRLRSEAEQAVDEGYSFVVLSDRAVSSDRVPASALLACGTVHQHLIEQEKRTRIGLLIETGEAREVHHHCCLVGYGADGINPYLAFEALWSSRESGELNGAFPDDEKLVKVYRKAVGKGMLKVFAKMGISTLQSYKGAQIFEAIGIGDDVMDLCFRGTASRIGGVDLLTVGEEILLRHESGYPTDGNIHLPMLGNDGQFHWRSNQERHMWDPQSIATLQDAARSNSSEQYWAFAKHVDESDRTRCTLRGLMKFKPQTPVPLDEVEPAKDLVKRFVTGAMSYGSISLESHSALAVAMNRLGGKSNTGEGGENADRYATLADGSQNPQRSAIKQVASGRFGVTINYLTNSDEIQIKMAQGAKPGEGGELPGRKVDEKIAQVRHSTPGVGLISPPPHHDIYSIEDLAQLIHDLKNSNPSARISVKLVSEVGVGTVAAGVAKAHADHILVSGHDGGTGASPVTSVKHAGLPWELGIAETHQTLVMNDLRSRVVLQTDGQLKTGRDVVIAGLLGAEEIGMSTGPLVAMGCIMMRKCHLNTCPVGIATQDPELRKKFQGKPEHVVNYMFMVAEHARELMAQLGFRTFRELVGRSDVLDTNEANKHWKSKGVSLDRILAPAVLPNEDVDVVCTRKQDHGLHLALDNHIIAACKPALRNGSKVRASFDISNMNRTVGAMLSHEIAKKRGTELLPEGTIELNFKGSAGQSFGAFLAKGVTLNLVGDANDYVGKGLSGGEIVVYPPRQSTFVPNENMIVGNVVLYGATSGKVFFQGRAAERFCVRNSGATAVVEGVGDHGCEYMTGGRVVILGTTGRNFAAGMSGGVAYVYDVAGDFGSKCNMELVDLERIEFGADSEELFQLIVEHGNRTGSSLAQAILGDWRNNLAKFVRVMPRDYKRVLDERASQSPPPVPTESYSYQAGLQ